MRPECVSCRPITRSETSPWTRSCSSTTSRLIRQVADRAVGDEQLRRRAASVGSHSSRLRPDQLGPALPHPPPAFARRCRGASLEIGVPSLERVHAEPIADGESREAHGRASGDEWPCCDIGLERELGADVLKVREELAGAGALGERTDAGQLIRPSSRRS